MVMNDMTDDGKWGAEIAVDGVRPEWLEDSDFMCWKMKSGFVHGPDHPSQKGQKPWTALTFGDRNSPAWNDLASIRLLADHPHYRQPQVRTTEEQLAHYAQRCQALVERMAALNEVSEVAVMHTQDYREAREIVAEAKAVDGDLVEARKVCEEVIPSGGAFLSGEWDIGDIVTAAVAAIKRGRQLAAGEGK